MSADITNGLFEFLAAGAIVLSIIRVLKDKSVKGISIPHVAFFSAWGLWNLYYYPSLSQTASFIAGILVVTVNTVWVVLLLRYRK